MTTTYGEEEENSSSSSDQHKPDDSGRKRKATEEMSDGEKGEVGVRRKKNREAAKKCRERKLQETDNLRKKNEQLEKENCELVRQRDELRQRCNDLEEKLKQHKSSGCMLSECSSSCSDLSHILDPTTPPSPSFAGSYTLSPCPSPATSDSSASPSLSGYTLPTYENDPPPVKYIYGGARNVAGGQSSAMTNPTSSQVNDSQVTLTEMGEVKNGQVTFPTTSQQTAGSVQDRHQLYSFRVRDNDGQPRNLRLSREDYMKVLARLKASKMASAKHHMLNDVSTPDYASAPESHLIFSTPQVSQGTLPEPISGVDQSVNLQSQTQVSMQNCKQNGTFNPDHDLMPFADLEGDTNDFLLVNPNDVLMETEEMDEYEQNSLGLPGCESVAVQHIVPDIEYMTDNDAELFQQMLPGQVEQMTRPGADVLTNACDQKLLHHLQNESVSKLGNDKTFTITVAIPNTSQVLEQTSALHNYGAGELALSLGSKGIEEPMPSQIRQTVPYTTSSAVSVTLTPTTITTTNSNDIPILFCIDEPEVLKKSISTSPTDTDFGGLTDHQQLSLDSISTLKLRPKARNVALPPGSRIQVENKPQMIRPQNASMSTQHVMTMPCATKNCSLGPLKDSKNTDSSETVGFQQASVGILPTYQNISTPNKFLPWKLQQQQVSQMPVVPVSQFSSPQTAQTIQLKAKPSDQVGEQTPLMTENRRNIVEYLALYSIETLDSA